ncbi:MAG: hypothetical protein KatS3mg105_0807 [Gemmatales bacterium]|nr:MAG: hypothetical protein KatS3mg105_0807 [Gemmatales bacterium]
MDGRMQSKTTGSSSEATNAFYVVGIGASAGGLEALEELFDKIPPDIGMAFIVVQHLSPDFKSMMNELLARHTQLPIYLVEDGMEVKPNAVYLIPPKKEMVISNGRLLLTDKDPKQGLALPIDQFFRSLAQDSGEHAIGIILSGSGSDGSRGIVDIHEAGGLVIVQDEETARFDGMPKAAIRTGKVDYVLPPHKIPEVLIKHAKGQIEIPRPATGEGDDFADLFQILCREYGIDFTHYKPTTVERRIERRLQLLQIPSLREYVERLRNDPVEVNRLYNDLLIGVTKFFRDREAFERLGRDVIPEIVDRTPPEQEIRVWVAGCATGEEAYSIAILFHEYLSSKKQPINVRIFATDVHRASLEFASAGIYSEASLSEVSAERLSRYFTKKDDGYQISPELRQMVVFAPHNLIKDAPFTRLDLISCRNLLIYFEQAVQKKVLSLFHFGLKTNGILFLGPSESTSELADEFDVIDRHWKIFRKRRDGRLPADMRLPMSAGYSDLRPGGSQRIGNGTPLVDRNLLRAYDVLLEQFVPPSLLINHQRELVHAFAGAGRFLTIRDGRISRDVLDHMDKDLRTCLSGALQRVAKEGTTVTYAGVRIRTNGREDQIKLTVKPIGRDDDPIHWYYLVIFENVQAAKTSATEAVDVLHVDESAKEQIEALENELRITKESLQATIEEMETSNEELQATNEELVAANEELQSTNEELHSVNEELYTVNAEYQRKIAELTQLTDDMENLFRSTDVAAIFLDSELRIRKFTPQISKTFQILPQDVGRRIDSFSHSIEHPTMIDDIRNVLNQQQTIEKEVRDHQGNHYLLRILPYYAGPKVEGVVLTLIDISALKRAETKLRRLSKVFEDAADPIIIEDLAGRIIDVNEEAVRAYGWEREELIGREISMLIPPAYHAHAEKLRKRCLQNEHVRNVEGVRRDKKNHTHPVLETLSLLSDEDGKPSAIASIAKDITKQKKAELKAQEAVRRREEFLAMLSHELRNPLSAVRNASLLLSHYCRDNAEMRKACDVLQRQCEHMARLLDDLLDVSRITQGKINIRKEIVDLVDITHHALELVQPLISRNKHVLETSISEKPILVEGDGVRLLQICLNLLTNAAKYTPPGGHIRVELSADQKQALFAVTDNGIGIPHDMQSKIFDLFVQNERSLHRSDGGMGIGLTLVRTLVRLHKGSIHVHSKGPNQGSRFEVRLPLTNKQPTEQKVADKRQVNSDNFPTVLIIEDNADSREMLASVLRLEGFTVFVAPDGRQGLEAIERLQPDIALVDIGLPEMDGFQLAHEVKQRQLPIRLIALTGYGTSENDFRAIRDTGFEHYFVKPVDIDELKTLLTSPMPADSGT